MPKKASNEPPKWLRMLSPEVPSFADRDRQSRMAKCAERSSASMAAPTTTTNNNNSDSDSDETVDLEDLLREEGMVTPATVQVPVPEGNNENVRANLLNTAGGGDIAAELSDNEDGSNL